MQTNFLIDLGNKSQVPILSFSAISSSHTSFRSPYFFQATQNDSSQVGAITSIIQAFGWREVVPIDVDNEFDEGVIPYLTDALQAINTRVPYRSVISPVASDDQIVEELYKLVTMQTRVFVVHMLPSLGSGLFTKAKQVGMMNQGYVWIITNGLTNLFTSLEPSVIESMQGVLGVRPYVLKTKALDGFQLRWKRKLQQENPSFADVELNIFGLLAYDATMALAMAVENAGTTNFGFDMTNVSTNATDLEAFGVSKNGLKLLESLSPTRFKGLTGDYTFVDGQLQSLTFQMLNVNGDGERGIGFWTPEKGLMKKLNLTSADSTSESHLEPIIWPGDFISIPKGWEVLTNEKILRIGVTVKNGFREFVKVIIDPATSKTIATGYCTDVFNVVMQALPYAINYEFIPFGLSDGTSGSYNDMIYQVKLGKFDVVVGDTTIVANRSRFVDFTLPYIESGVSMIVPIKDSDKKNAWVFLKPLTRDLWMTVEEWDALFQNGTASGDIATAFDEIAYLKLFMGKHCSKYTIVEPKFKTVGFGFTFPLGSPLVPNVSRAILNVTEGRKMNEIEDAWFKKNSCPDLSTLVSSHSFGLNSFYGLFLIAGITSILALIIFMAIFVYEHRKILKESDHRYTFSSQSLPASPSSYSQHPCFCGEQGMPLTEYGGPNPKPSGQAPQDIVLAVELTNPN
ncbi:hypothetical protein Patl1_12655 [Pistacia atlantica]|uniref:Uncharacterized protein n=1 Tax=Pistacia atlantica TaxID=434234 RepID=A0ACC1AW99_9ROSI|nr:hypothetical protein Patl1_12655 [Pistacia atlantica]